MINSQIVVQGHDIVVEKLSWIDRELRVGVFQDARPPRRLWVLLDMRSINGVPCAIGVGVIGTGKVRWRAGPLAQRLDN